MDKTKEKITQANYWKTNKNHSVMFFHYDIFMAYGMQLRLYTSRMQLEY